METVGYTMEVPKETKEVFDALEGLILHFKAKKSVTEAAALLPSVLAAVDKIDQLDDEAKTDKLDESVGYGIHKIMGALRSGGHGA
jgi:hypothetical protein